jgi:hypothetical protein
LEHDEVWRLTTALRRLVGFPTLSTEHAIFDKLHL